MQHILDSDVLDNKPQLRANYLKNCTFSCSSVFLETFTFCFYAIRFEIVIWFDWITLSKFLNQYSGCCWSRCSYKSPTRSKWTGVSYSRLDKLNVQKTFDSNELSIKIGWLLIMDQKYIHHCIHLTMCSGMLYLFADSIYFWMAALVCLK